MGRSVEIPPFERALKFIGRLAVRLWESKGESSQPWPEEVLESTLRGAVRDLPPGKLKAALQSDPWRFSAALADRLQTFSKADRQAEDESPLGREIVANEAERVVASEQVAVEQDLRTLPEKQLRAVEVGELLTSRGYLKSAIAAIEAAHAGLPTVADGDRWRRGLQRLLRARQDPPWELWSVYAGLVWTLESGTEETWKLSEKVLRSWPASVELVEVSDKADLGSISADVAAAQGLLKALKESSCLFRKPEFGIAALEPVAGVIISIVMTLASIAAEGPKGLKEKLTEKGASRNKDLRAKLKLLQTMAADLASTAAIRRLLSSKSSLPETSLPPCPPPFPGGLIASFRAESREVSTVERAAGVLEKIVVLRMVTEILTHKFKRKVNGTVRETITEPGALFYLKSSEVAQLQQLAIQVIADVAGDSLGGVLDLLLRPELCLTSCLNEVEKAVLQGALYSAVLVDVGLEQFPGGTSSQRKDVELIYLMRMAVARKGMMLFRKRGERSRAVAIAAAASKLRVPPRLLEKLQDLKAQGMVPTGVSLPSSALKGSSRTLTALLTDVSNDTLLQLLLSAASGREDEGLKGLTDSAEPALKTERAGEAESTGAEAEVPLFFLDTKGDPAIAVGIGSVDEDDNEGNEDIGNRAFAAAALAMRGKGSQKRGRRKSDGDPVVSESLLRVKKGRHGGREWVSDGEESGGGSEGEPHSLLKRWKAMEKPKSGGGNSGKEQMSDEEEGEAADGMEVEMHDDHEDAKEDVITEEEFRVESYVVNSASPSAPKEQDDGEAVEAELEDVGVNHTPDTKGFLVFRDREEGKESGPDNEEGKDDHDEAMEGKLIDLGMSHTPNIESLEEGVQDEPEVGGIEEEEKKVTPKVRVLRNRTVSKVTPKSRRKRKPAEEVELGSEEAEQAPKRTQRLRSTRKAGKRTVGDLEKEEGGGEEVKEMAGEAEEVSIDGEQLLKTPLLQVKPDSPSLTGRKKGRRTKEPSEVQASEDAPPLITKEKVKRGSKESEEEVDAPPLNTEKEVEGGSKKSEEEGNGEKEDYISPLHTRSGRVAGLPASAMATTGKKAPRKGRGASAMVTRSVGRPSRARQAVAMMSEKDD